jgi:hypothetical protein
MEEVAEQKIVRKRISKVIPYLDGKSSNFGLAEYKEVIAPTAVRTEYLACLEVNGVPRYLTGLDEYAPEVQRIEDKKKKDAVIKEIREKVAFLERALIANPIDIKDEKFWEKVKVVHPTNYKFWEGIYIAVSNEPLFLDYDDPNQLILLCAIKAGGFSDIASSFDDARMSPISPKFYLDEETSTAMAKNEVTRLKNKAKASLEDLMAAGGKKLFFVTKNIDSNSYRYTNATSSDVMYAFLDEYIDGKGQFNAKQASINFNKALEMSQEDLMLRAVIADASFHKIINRKADQRLYHHKSDTMVGGNVEDVVEYLKNPLNSKVADQLIKEVELRWQS